MSSANLVTIPRGRHLLDLESQLRTFADPPERLVLRCEEPDPARTPGWEQVLGPALVLRTPGATLSDPGLREALYFAVRELGTKELVVLLHSCCSHLSPGSGPDQEVREKGLPFMDRVYARMARAQGRLQAARNQVRTAIHTLADDPLLEQVDTVGLVQIVESGVMVAYDPERDAFEAVL